VYRRYPSPSTRSGAYTLLAYQEVKSLAANKRSPLFDRERRIAEGGGLDHEGVIGSGAQR